MHPGQRGLAGIGVEADTTGAVTASCLRIDGFRHHQPGARYGHMAEMHEVPIRHAAVLGAELAHRRDDNPIGQCKPAKRERGE